MRESVITIDGPAGSGKSTIAQMLAQSLGCFHLNSGALYRIVAYLAIERGFDLQEEGSLCQLAQGLDVSLELNPDGRSLLLVDRCDFSSQVKSQEVGAAASQVAVLPKLRAVLTEVQRQLAQGRLLVVEGRDSGSVVFPQAALKLYLVATAAERAQRRFKELRVSNPEITLEAVQAGLLERDRRDREREASPEVKPEGAWEIDTSNLTPEQIVDKIKQKAGETLSI